jgi:DNA-binding transcriptional ArsR family regulator
MPRDHSDSRADDTGSRTTAAGLADDQLYRGLAATERRRVLYSLLTVGPATAEQLATVLAGWRASDRGRLVTADQREELLTELVHIHLPLLEEAGLVVRERTSSDIEIATLDPAVMRLVRDSIAAETGEG